jgi:hypothetical protein
MTRREIRSPRRNPGAHRQTHPIDNALHALKIATWNANEEIWLLRSTLVFPLTIS